MRKPLETVEIFQKRRKVLAEKMTPGAVLVLASLPEVVRNGNVHHPFRQDSNVYYLTGFEEPETIFVFRPGQSPESILFVRPKDPDKEIWDGFRFGPQLAQENFKIDQTFLVSEFAQKMPGFLKGATEVHYRQHRNSRMDQLFSQALLDHKMSLGRTGQGVLPVFDSDELMGLMRLFKTAPEIENHRRACAISAEAHVEVMKATRPGVSERELHGLFIHQIMKRGAAREGYGGIFASGGNSCILHYVFNDQVLKSGDMLLVDAGAEFQYYTGDITRAYPVNGKFTAAQKEVYEGVLHAQKQVMARIHVGEYYKVLHETAVSELTQVILDLGLISGRKEDVIQSGEYKKYFPHGLGHFLGMDVHDLGLYVNRKNEFQKIEPGMVFTIEPGLYIPPGDENAPKEFHGVGVRIEDDVLVTTNDFEVMTAKCPKEVSELESLVGSASGY